MHYSSVEVVSKDSKKREKVDGWRLIWKSSPLIKFYDLIRSKCIKPESIDNAAYKRNSSVHVALGSLFSRYYPENVGLLGVDYKDAFGLACRQCLNQVLGVNFMPDLINFDIFVNKSSSCDLVSYIGTGAGRPSGGTGFTILLDSLFKQSDLVMSDVALYADDSQVVTKLCNNEISKLLNIFSQGSQYGLQVHMTGKKAPTLLVNRKSKFSAIDLVSTVHVVRFLGLNLKIGDNGLLYAIVNASELQKLNFLAFSLNSTLKIAYSDASCSEFKSMFALASQSIDALIESRIQYSIVYMDTTSLYKIYNIHRRVICSLLNINPTFFGFKNRKDFSNEKCISNLLEEFEKISSETYLTLCRIACRPNIYQIAIRAANVLSKQLFEKVPNNRESDRGQTDLPRLRTRRSKFEVKIGKILNDKDSKGFVKDRSLLNEFLSFKTFKRRREFIKFCTSRFFKRD